MENKLIKMSGLSPEANQELYKYLADALMNLVHASRIDFVLTDHNEYFPAAGIELTGSYKKILQETVKNRNMQIFDKIRYPELDLPNPVICTMIHESLFLLVSGSEKYSSFSDNNIKIIQYFSKYIDSVLNDLFTDKSGNQGIDSYLNSVSVSVQLVSELLKYRLSSVKYENQLNEFINVSGLINSSLHLNDVLEAVMFSAKAVFSTESCSLLLLDAKKEYLYFHTIAGEKKEEIAKIKVPVGQGIAGIIAMTKKPMIINDALTDPRVFRKVDNESNFVTRNILGAPLIANDNVIGVIEAINTVGRNRFDESDIELFVSFSDAVALAIQRTGLLDSLEKTNRELKSKISETESLFKLGQAVVESKDIDELFFRSVNIIAEQFDCHRAAIIIVDDDREMINISALIDSSFMKFQDSFFRDSIIIDSLINNKTVLKPGNEFNFTDKLDGTLLFNSYIIIPLIQMEKRPIGVLCISDCRDGRSYTENDIRLLKTVSTQVIKGYETFRLYENTIAKREMEKELEVTRQIQNNILPSRANFNSNFDLGFLFKPAKEVSGDFYDFFQFDNGVFSALVADVSGKSLPAAIFMAMSSSTIRAFSRRPDMEPNMILEKANNLIYEDSHSGMFVTTFFLKYHPGTMSLNFASAGHNEQFLLKKDNSVQVLKTRGLPLGVIQGGRYTSGKTSVSPGDMIVLYTDGVVEEKDDDNEEFGLNRMIDEIRSVKEKSSQEICEHLYRRVADFRGKNDPFDDFTLVIIKFNDDYQYKKTFAAVTSQIPEFREYVYQIIKGVNCDEMAINDILLACDEAATNIVMHAYHDTTIKNPKFEVYLRILDHEISIKLADWGIQFKRDQVKDPSIEENLKGRKKGGFGVFLIEKLMDRVSYDFVDMKNVMVMDKTMNKLNETDN